MKILILTPQLPYPPHQGTSLRNFHIIRGLAERHQITLLSFLEAGQTAVSSSIQPLQTLCHAIETVPVPTRTTAKRLWQLLTTRQPDMAHRLFSEPFNVKLRQLLAENQFDIVQIEGIELASAAKIIRVVSPANKLIFDDHNAETELQRRNFLTDLRTPRRWIAAAYSWVQLHRLRRFEGWICNEADGVAAVSDTDRKQLQKLTIANGQLSIITVPNSIDVQSYQMPHPQPILFDLMFSGKMDYRPNVDAVLWFASEVWPGIKRKRPSTTWVIVGQKPHQRLDGLRELEGITLTGWVESVLPYLHGATVPIMPFRIGSGTRLKIVEAMAAGKSIVSTPVGAEGFPVTHNREMLLAGTSEEMETAVIHLLNSPSDRERLGQAAQTFAQQYDWRNIIPRFNELYEAKII